MEKQDLSRIITKVNKNLDFQSKKCNFTDWKYFDINQYETIIR